MATTTTLRTEDDCLDFVRGCTFMATGGGGPPVRGMEILRRQIQAGAPVGWVDPSSIPDDVYTLSVFGMGGRPPAGHPTPEELASFGLREPRAANTMEEAVKELATYAGVTVGAVVPIELGGSNTPGPLAAAATLGMLVPDGDYTGRAIPEITQTTPSLGGHSAAPLSAVDRWGNVSILAEVTGDAMAERIGKLLSQAAFGGVSRAGFLMPASAMKQVLVQGTLSRCLAIGGAIRQAQSQGQDAVEALRRFVDGLLIFRGRVAATEQDDSEGYRYGIGTHRLVGSGSFAGKRCSIWYKNENHICWLNDQPYVTSPDIISIVDGESAEPVINSAVMVGQEVAVIGLRAVPAFRSPAGVERLGPHHFGFAIEYVPIEQRLS
ncbi:MAG: DUF917 domain-containing protein [Dehalococcoidia bacterium]